MCAVTVVNKGTRESERVQEGFLGEVVWQASTEQATRPRERADGKAWWRRASWGRR